MQTRLTKRAVDALVAPPAGAPLVETWDTELKGFGVRVSHTGRKTYFVKKRTQAGRQVKITLGVHGAVTADQAREAAMRELGRIADGADPVEVKRRARAAERARRTLPTVAELAERFLDEHVAVHDRPRTLAEYRGLIKRHIKPRLGDIKVPDVEYDDIATLHRALKATPYVANRVLAVLSKMFSLAVIWKLRPANPVKGVQRYPEQRRQRFLSAAELARLGEALAAYPFQISANAIRLLLLTGARRMEVLAMTWEMVEAEAGIWVKPSSLTKQKTVHRVPLSPGARQLLDDMKKYRDKRALGHNGGALLDGAESAFVFSGRSRGTHLTDVKKAWATVCEKAGLGKMVPKVDRAGKAVVDKDKRPVLVFKPGVRVHDLRHTYASILASSGASLPVIGALLGHSQPQTTARYAHLADDPLQEAANRVDALLTALSSGTTAEVLPLRHR